MLNNGATQLKLTTLRTPISNGALAADKLPDRLKLANWGDNPSTKGNFRLTEHSAAVLPKRQADLGFAEIALDFEHNTVPGTDEYERTKEPRPVAAYGVPRIVPGEGLFLEGIRWTPEGQRSALNYVDLSPAVATDDSGNITFVHSASLVRNGSVHGLSFYSVTLASKETQKDQTMPEKFIALSALAIALGLPEASEEKDVLSKFKERLTPAPELTPLSALLKDGKIIIVDTVADLANRVKTIETAATKGIATLSAKIDGKDVSFTAEDVVALTARVAKIEADAKKAGEDALAAERSKIVPLFAKEGKAPNNPETGKAYTADELGKLDLATLKVLHANTPVTVPLTARTRTATADGKSDKKGLARAIEEHKAGR